MLNFISPALLFLSVFTVSWLGVMFMSCLAVMVMSLADVRLEPVMFRFLSEDSFI